MYPIQHQRIRRVELQFDQGNRTTLGIGVHLPGRPSLTECTKEPMKLTGAIAVFASLFMLAGAKGATIDLSTLLGNPIFELGNQASGCPVDWTCTGSPSPGFSSYVVTSAQYTAGADGLSSGIVPVGTSAATSPTYIEGSGVLSQTNLGTYQAGDTYDLYLWIGTPNTLPTDNTTPVAPVGVIEVDFTGTGTSALWTVDPPSIPAAGQWTLDEFSFTPDAADVGQPIGIDIFDSSAPPSGGSGNNRIANYDIGSSTSPPPNSTMNNLAPEPGTFALIGAGLIALFFFGRRQRSVS